tara:strand:- start:5672 stop:6598 length:927 start_codon:yes stop_codon:yes gene_type:complete
MVNTWQPEMGESEEEQIASNSIPVLLEQLHPQILTATRGSIDVDGIYGCALKASVAKSFEFAAFSNQDPAPLHGFFITSSLRGICEDLIAFSFLDALDPDDRNKALILLMDANVSEGLEAQSNFFEEFRPWQPVVQPPKTPVSDPSVELRKLSRKLGWNGKNSWPSTWFMAKKSGLQFLYSYLYSATSKWVHFSPHILLRMGWGGDGKDRESLGSHTEWEFTTKNFSDYYKEFNQIYSVMLLLKLLRGPAMILFSDELMEIIDQLEDILDKPLRWPELVTYEELNIEGPGVVHRLALQFIHEKKLEKP